MTSTTDYDNVEITQQYSHVNMRFELSDEELDNDHSSARRFERSRIKALAGKSATLRLRKRAAAAQTGRGRMMVTFSFAISISKNCGIFQLGGSSHNKFYKYLYKKRMSEFIKCRFQVLP